VLAAVLLALSGQLTAGSSARAQQAPSGTGTPDAGAAAGAERQNAPPVSFLTGYRFHMSAASLRTPDVRFDLDCHLGGDIDFIDYKYGRLNFLADYDVVLGSQLHNFDPNQSNYRLEFFSSIRTRAGEVQPFFHHASRHLGDRSNPIGVSWNTAGAMVSATGARGPVTLNVDGGVGYVTAHSFVDYTWQVVAGGEAHYRFTPRYAFVARSNLDLRLVDRTIAGRGRQVGGEAEVALRVYGSGAAMELFAGWERRIDAYPLDRVAGAWALVGFRFLSR
jgi:hypothetical protein